MEVSQCKVRSLGEIGLKVDRQRDGRLVLFVCVRKGFHKHSGGVGG